MQNTRKTDIIPSSVPRMVKDLNESYYKDGQYLHMRNGVNVSINGDRGVLQTEPSNVISFKAPYKINEVVEMNDRNEFLVFSTDGTNSEIGKGSLNDNSYTTILNLPCLNFSNDYPIKAVIKQDFIKGMIVYFTDRYNPVRRAELRKLPSVTNCEDILLWKQIDIPTIRQEKGVFGTLPNGSYSVAMAYVIDGQRYSEYYSITQKLHLYSKGGANSISVTIDNLDKEFDQYQLVLIADNDGVETVYVQGYYSTKQKKVSISDFGLEQIQLSDLVIKNKTWQKAGIMSSNSSYLILADLVARKEINYQLKAFQIKTQYVIEQVPADHYREVGTDFSYWRNERYNFNIEGIYKTGESTPYYHIAGPNPTSEDLAIATGVDVFEFDNNAPKECRTEEEVRNYQVRNTAGEMVPTNDEFSCNRRTLGYGTIGAWLSTELYPDNVELFGEKANKPMQFHMMPDECKVPRYQVVNGQEYINIVGVRFLDIPNFDDQDIIGYRITRSDRHNNRSVIARGILTNTRGYTKNNTNYLYSNYPLNDLSPDQFISSRQTVYKNKREQNFTPLSLTYNDRFNFYSPHSFFYEKYKMGTEFRIETEEVADVTGQFREVYKHPKGVLLSNFSFWLAAAVGFVRASLVILGNTDITTKSGLKIGLDGGPYYEIEDNLQIKTVDDLVSLPPEKLISILTAAIKAADISKISTIVSLLRAAIQTISGLALKIPYSLFVGISEADKVIDIIEDFLSPINYTLQYNCVGKYNKSICVASGNKRRVAIEQPLYLSSALNSVDNSLVFNNFNREKSVYIHLNRDIKTPSTNDNSRKTLSGFNACGDINSSTTSRSSAFYATSMVANPNQYGQLGSTSIIKVSDVLDNYKQTPTLFGGDCVITRWQVQKRHKFFTQDLGDTTFPDKTEYDYRLYPNIGYPRYWANTTRYNFSQLLSKNVVNQERFSRSTSSKYNLDCKQNDGDNVFRIDNSCMYTSSNGVMDFFVEADYNISFREDTQYPHYSEENTNLEDIFRADRLKFPEEFKLNRAFNNLQVDEVANNQLRLDYKEAEAFPTEQPNSVIYSLPSFNLQSVDNWQYFLPLNYFAFSETDFGTLTQVHKIDQDRLIFLMSKSSPYISTGRDFLQLEQSGRKITIGDGGLFAQDPREIMPTDNNYGATRAKWAFSNTHLGRFYPSDVQGRILSFDNSLKDITVNRMEQWCHKYIPFFLNKFFPSVKENPLNSIGYLSAFDSTLSIYYLTKRDFLPLYESITHLNDKYFYNELEISLHDTQYFRDISWTLSYDALSGEFISFHDWHPDGTVQTDNHFLAIKGDTVYRHNETQASFCEFFGVKYPFEFQPVTNSTETEIVSSLEYVLEGYIYGSDQTDSFNVLNANFDRLVVSNQEQISPNLTLIHQKSLKDRLNYPRKNTIGWDVLFSKEEQKYTINQFWDAVKDRGEFTTTMNNLWNFDESGYKKNINPDAIDLDKQQRKKFRSKWATFLFSKLDIGKTKLLIKWFMIKKTLSIR